MMTPDIDAGMAPALCNGWHCFHCDEAFPETADGPKAVASTFYAEERAAGQ